MVGGIAMFSKLALMGTLFYLIHDIMVKTNMFLISGVIMQLRGVVTMEKLGGLYKEYPKISLLIAIVLLSLVGIPLCQVSGPKYTYSGRPSMSTSTFCGRVDSWQPGYIIRNCQNVGRSVLERSAGRCCS